MHKKNKTKFEFGQGLIEYALIMVLISVATIVSMQVLGPAIGNVFSDIDESMSYLSVTENVVVSDCQFRQHGDHYHWGCGVKDTPDYEHGRYECGDFGEISPELIEQLEFYCAS